MSQSIKYDYVTLPTNSRFHELTLQLLDKNIANGSFNSVSKAKVIETGEIVAFKQSSIPLSDDVLELTGNMSFLPRTLYRAERYPYLIVEEWIDGTTLFELAKDKKLQKQPFEKICTMMINALSYLLYDCRVFHGDLTPSNLMWSGDGKAGQIFLLDFDPWYRVNNHGLVVTPHISGSMPFLPPEYLFGNLSFNGDKALAYCVGSILYYLQYGFPPFCEAFCREDLLRLMFGPQTGNKELDNKIQQIDFRNWKTHLATAKPIAQKSDPNPYTNTLSNMLAIDSHKRLGFKTAATFLIDYFQS